MAWDPGSRLKLNALREEGVVAVRYHATGCNVELEVLPCVAGGPTSYKFSPYNANERKVAHNASELFAQLPVGAARLAGSVKGTRALRTDYMLAGQFGLPTGTSFKASDLRGPRAVCERATHVVSAVYVGAFAMAAGESREIEASASLLGAGAGSKHNAAVESLGEEGDAEACKASQKNRKESGGCSVPLRIGLLALEGAGAPGAARVPGVGPVVEAPAVVASGSCPSGMASIPAGRFTMGASDGDADANEKPSHAVNVATFCMDATEVTTAAYAACVTAGACATAGFGMNCNGGQPGRANHPINCVDWNQATAYCNFMSKRLPTEEEWEYGARGTEGFKYPWGNTPLPTSKTCLEDPNRFNTCVVGSYPADKSPFGLMDMGGNVSEWTASGYSEDYSKPRDNAVLVTRGSAYNYSHIASTRGARRIRESAARRDAGLGFRCAR